MRLSFKHRLYPNRPQTGALTGKLGAFCDLYNAALQQRAEAYRRRGVTLRYDHAPGLGVAASIPGWSEAVRRPRRAA
jgi:transposase